MKRNYTVSDVQIIVSYRPRLSEWVIKKTIYMVAKVQNIVSYRYSDINSLMLQCEWVWSKSKRKRTIILCKHVYHRKERCTTFYYIVVHSATIDFLSYGLSIESGWDVNIASRSSIGSEIIGFSVVRGIWLWYNLSTNLLLLITRTTRGLDLANLTPCTYCASSNIGTVIPV